MEIITPENVGSSRSLPLVVGSIKFGGADKERRNKRVSRKLSKFRCMETFVSKHGPDNNSYCGRDSNLRTINAANPGLKRASPSS